MYLTGASDRVRFFREYNHEASLYVSKVSWDVTLYVS